MAKKRTKPKSKSLSRPASADRVPSGLVTELRDLIAQTRGDVARAVKSALVQLYWQVGTRIRTEILKNERADYGKQIVGTLSGQLAAEFGSGFSKPNLVKMLAFAECFSKEQIELTLSTQLSWSHFVELIRIKAPLASIGEADPTKLNSTKSSA